MNVDIATYMVAHVHDYDKTTDIVFVGAWAPACKLTDMAKYIYIYICLLDMLYDNKIAVAI